MNAMEKPQHISKQHLDLGQLPERPDSLGSSSMFLRTTCFLGPRYRGLM